MLKKITFIIATLLIIGCTEKSSKIEDPGNVQTGERKSIHQQEAEKNEQDNNINVFSENYNIIIENTEAITDRSLGNFQIPKFTYDGKYIIFTNQDYSQLWLYNLENKSVRKIVDLPQCGNGYQISESNDNIYFRNRAKQERKGGVYSIFKYSISSESLDVLYKSNNRISHPTLLKDEIFFLDNDIPTKFNLMSKKIDTKFKTPFFFADNNLLIRVSTNVDKISFSNKNYKIISCEYSQDRENIIALTTNNGILVVDMNGKLIKKFDHAISLSKLNKSNLVVYSDQKDDGQKIKSSELSIGFINSDRRIELTNNENEIRLGPDWSPKDNKIAYATDDGLIKIISFNIEKKTK